MWENDFSRPGSRLRNLGQSLLHVFNIRSRAGQNPAARIGVGDDCRQRLVDLVGDGSRHLPQGGHSDHPRQFCLGGLNRVLRPPAFGQIPRNLGKTNQLSLGVVQRGENHVGLEARSVFTEPPSVFFEPARGCSFTKGHGRLALAQIFVAIKTGVMLSDNLLGKISLDALRSAVPAGDEPFRVQHENRVVGDAFDQQAKSLFASAQFFGRLPALGNIQAQADHPEGRTFAVAMRPSLGQHPAHRAIRPLNPILGIEFSARPERLANGEFHRRLDPRDESASGNSTRRASARPAAGRRCERSDRTTPPGRSGCPSPTPPLPKPPAPAAVALRYL